MRSHACWSTSCRAWTSRSVFLGKTWRSEPVEMPASAATVRMDTQLTPLARMTRQVAVAISSRRRSWSMSFGTF